MRLPIIQYGDPVLRTEGKPVDEIDGTVRNLALDMIETMHAAQGVGLAAQQIGKPLQLAVIDTSYVEDRSSAIYVDGAEMELVTTMPLVLVNPYLQLSKETTTEPEGCLSFWDYPNVKGEIERASSVVARFQNLEGDWLEIEAHGLLARVLQHETDHLKGILFIDRMTSVDKAKLPRHFRRLEKLAKRRSAKLRQPLVF
jgi:peptide deformylase